MPKKKQGRRIKEEEEEDETDADTIDNGLGNSAECTLCSNTASFTAPRACRCGLNHVKGASHERKIADTHAIDRMTGLRRSHEPGVIRH